MLGRAFAVTAILVLGAFAGCISKGGDDTPQTTNETNTANGVLDANESAAAPDGRGQLSAFKETNRTESNGTGAMEHKHDYWHGQDRAHVDDIFVPLIPFPLLPCKQAGTCTTGGGGETYPAGTAIADFDIRRPDPAAGIGGLIYEGSSSVELLPNYIVAQTVQDGVQVPNPNAHVFFDYLTAADEPGQFHEGGELKAGTPFVIPIKPTEADMPHQTKSLWIFRIYSDSSTLTFEMNLTVTAVKGGTVVDWPPHPDLYADKSERLIFEGPVASESKGTVDSNIYGSDSLWVHPERILSWGTERIEIEISGVTLTTDAPVPASGYVLDFHNASKSPLLGNGAQYGGRLTDDGSDGTTYHYTIDITNDFDSYDTPYGQKSRWGFRFVPQFDNAAGACIDGDSGVPAGSFIQQFLVGCQFVPWKMQYTMKVVAYGKPHTSELPDPALGGTSS
ncbi:MAG TPA: hypothetical protein VM370_11475 [Candidatus Thermoplasmatota archaeon]|nr:hypothetical protein [Candidatus Thermoplasmatota archaeon]